MRKIVLIVLIILPFIGFSQCTQWVQKADFSIEGRRTAVGFSINGKGYITLGVDTLGVNPTNLLEFNPVANSWILKAPFPGVSRIRPISFSLGGKGYVGGGAAGQTDFYAYNPAINIWVRMANLPVSANQTASFSDGSFGYLLCDDNNIYKYDPTSNTWTNFIAGIGCCMQGSRMFYLASTNKAYYLDGQGGGGNFWELDLATLTWITKSPDPAASNKGVVFEINGKGYFGLGQGGVLLRSMNEYDPVKDIWTAMELFTPLEGIKDLAFFTINNKGYIASGSSGFSAGRRYTWEYTPEPLKSNENVTNASCFGASDGVISTSIINGKTPYSYVWNTFPVQTTNVANNLTAGGYNVTISDGNSCSIIKSNTITEPSPLNILGTTIPVSCNGGADGSVNISVTGGTSPYFYNWSNGAATQNIAGLLSGIYSVTVDDGTCLNTQSYILTEPTAISLITTVNNNISCSGASDGSIVAVVSGGTPPYTYLWNTIPAQNSTIATGLNAGTYTVTVYDANACFAVGSVVLTNPAVLTVSNPPTIVNVSCASTCDGSIQVFPTGGTTPYTYSWTPNWQTTATITGLCAGNQTLLLTDVNGCTYTSTAAVATPSPLVAGVYTIGGATPNYTTINAAVTDLMCRGISGSVIMNIRNGIYNEQIKIGLIPGAAFGSDVTFTSESGDSTAVVITFNASFTNNYTIELNATSFVNFVRVTFKATNTTYGHVIEIEGASNDCAIYNCILNGVATTLTADNMAVIYSSAAADETFITIQNNDIYDGSFGIKMLGTAGLEHGNVVDDNVIEGFYLGGIYLNNQKAISVAGNYIYTESTLAGTVQMLGLIGCVDNISVTDNEIFSISANAEGINETNCVGSPGVEGLLANNMIRVKGRGMVIDGSSSQLLYHNSLETLGAGGNGITTINGASNIQIQNNIAYASGGGYALFADVTAGGGVTLSDNNDFVSSGINAAHWEGTNAVTALELNAISGQDANSLSINPLFVSNTDLHLSVTSPLSLKGGANLSTLVSFDIDGSNRDVVPWMGCDERLIYYWVSNTGLWSDAGKTHWATSSGGAAFHTTPPSSSDYVVFDINSFTGPGQLLEIDIDGYAKQIDFQDITKTPVLHGAGALTIGL